MPSYLSYQSIKCPFFEITSPAKTFDQKVVEKLRKIYNFKPSRVAWMLFAERYFLYKGY